MAIEWFEGPVFLEEVFRRLREGGGGVEAITLREYLERHPVCVEATPAASTWGAGGYGDVWVGQRGRLDVAPRAPRDALREAPRRQAPRAPTAFGGQALDQLIRELLLLQSSDWAFILEDEDLYRLMPRSDHARTHSHRLRHLGYLVERESIEGADVTWLEDLCRRDNFLAQMAGDELRSRSTRDQRPRNAAGILGRRAAGSARNRHASSTGRNLHSARDAVSRRARSTDRLGSPRRDHRRASIAAARCGPWFLRGTPRGRARTLLARRARPRNREDGRASAWPNAGYRGGRLEFDTRSHRARPARRARGRRPPSWSSCPTTTGPPKKGWCATSSKWPRASACRSSSTTSLAERAATLAPESLLARILRARAQRRLHQGGHWKRPFAPSGSLQTLG